MKTAFGLPTFAYQVSGEFSMIMAAAELIATYPDKLDEHAVREEMEGNFCRCTGYHNIVRAILAAAEEMNGSDGVVRPALDHAAEARRGRPLESA